MARVNYHEYMASREWRIKRREVLARSGGVCERCWGAPATQVHHATYARLGNERPEDLVALCRPDHEYLSAESDVDPVASIPLLNDDWMGRLSEARARCVWLADENPEDESNGRFARTLIWLSDPIFRWVQRAGEAHRSLPEREIIIAPASCLYTRLAEGSSCSAGLCHGWQRALGIGLLQDFGLDLVGPHDPWQRWVLPADSVLSPAS